MKLIARLVFLIALLSPFSACHSTSGGVSFGSPDCVCGQPDAAITGCYHRRCITGLGNPDNPACYCGGLAFTGEARQLVSDGGSSQSRLIGKTQTLYLANGKTIKGTLLQENGVLVRLRTSSGERQIEYSELAPRSVYRLEKGRTPPDDGLGLAKLGDLARKAGYWAHASRHYRDALAADASLAPRLETSMAELREEASQDVLARAREDVQKKKVKDAEKNLTTILTEFPDEPAAVEAATMLDRIHSESQRTRSIPSSDERLAKLFETPRKELERAANFNHKGLVNRNQSRALGSYKNALKNLDKAVKQIGKIEEKYSDDRQVQAMARSLGDEVSDLYVTTTLNMVSVYMVQTSYNKALEAVNTALAMSPKNERLLNTRARIEYATSDSDWGFGWVRRGR